MQICTKEVSFKRVFMIRITSGETENCDRKLDRLLHFLIKD